MDAVETNRTETDDRIAIRAIDEMCGGLTCSVENALGTRRCAVLNIRQMCHEVPFHDVRNWGFPYLRNRTNNDRAQARMSADNIAWNLA
jgi:hypothetical protein